MLSLFTSLTGATPTMSKTITAPDLGAAPVPRPLIEDEAYASTWAKLEGLREQFREVGMRIEALTRPTVDKVTEGDLPTASAVWKSGQLPDRRERIRDTSRDDAYAEARARQRLLAQAIRVGEEELATIANRLRRQHADESLAWRTALAREALATMKRVQELYGIEADYLRRVEAAQDHCGSIQPCVTRQAGKPHDHQSGCAFYATRLIGLGLIDKRDELLNGTGIGLADEKERMRLHDLVVAENKAIAARRAQREREEHARSKAAQREAKLRAKHEARIAKDKAEADERFATSALL